MAKYTTELRTICESLGGYVEGQDYSNVNEVIEKARPLIFDFDYPIFDETYRPVLENKILKRYYTREISGESFGIWKLWLNTRLNEIMPYYNKLYLSELIEFNPMYDVDLTTDKLGHGQVGKNGSNSGTSTKSGGYTDASSYANNDKLDRWDEYSDTPQGGLTGIAEHNYLTNARHIKDDTTGSTGTGSTTRTYDNDKTENDGSFTESMNRQMIISCTLKVRMVG